jgi:hypothetical protein
MRIQPPLFGAVIPAPAMRLQQIVALAAGLLNSPEQLILSEARQNGVLDVRHVDRVAPRLSE